MPTTYRHQHRERVDLSVTSDGGDGGSDADSDTRRPHHRSAWDTQSPPAAATAAALHHLSPNGSRSEHRGVRKGSTSTHASASSFQRHTHSSTTRHGAAVASLPECLQSLSQLPAATALPYFYAHDNPQDAFYNVPAVVHELITALSRRVQVLEERAEWMDDAERGRDETHAAAPAATAIAALSASVESVSQRIDLSESRLTAVATMISALEARVTSTQEQLASRDHAVQRRLSHFDHITAELQEQQAVTKSAMADYSRTLNKHRFHLKALLNAANSAGGGGSGAFSPSPAAAGKDSRLAGGKQLNDESDATTTPVAQRQHRDRQRDDADTPSQQQTITCSHGTLLELAEALRRRPHEMSAEVLSPAAFVATEVDLLIRAHVAEELARCGSDAGGLASRRSTSSSPAAVGGVAGGSTMATHENNNNTLTEALVRSVDEVRLQVHRLSTHVQDTAQRVEVLSVAAATPPRPSAVLRTEGDLAATEALVDGRLDALRRSVEQALQSLRSTVKAAASAKDMDDLREAINARIDDSRASVLKEASSASQKLVTSSLSALQRGLTADREEAEAAMAAMDARVDAAEAALRRASSATATEMQEVRSVVYQALDNAQQALTVARGSGPALLVRPTAQASVDVQQASASTTAAAMASLVQEVAQAASTARSALDAVAILQAQHAAANGAMAALQEAQRRLEVRCIGVEAQSARSVDDVAERLGEVSRLAIAAESEARSAHVQIRAHASRSSTPVVTPLPTVPAMSPSDVVTIIRDELRRHRLREAQSAEAAAPVPQPQHPRRGGGANSPVGEWVQATELEVVSAALQRSSEALVDTLRRDLTRMIDDVSQRVAAMQAAVHETSASSATSQVASSPPVLGASPATLDMDSVVDAVLRRLPTLPSTTAPAQPADATESSARPLSQGEAPDARVSKSRDEEKDELQLHDKLNAWYASSVKPALDSTWTVAQQDSVKASVSAEFVARQEELIAAVIARLPPSVVTLSPVVAATAPPTPTVPSDEGPSLTEALVAWHAEKVAPACDALRAEMQRNFSYQLDAATQDFASRLAEVATTVALQVHSSLRHESDDAAVAAATRAEPTGPMMTKPEIEAMIQTVVSSTVGPELTRISQDAQQFAIEYCAERCDAVSRSTHADITKLLATSLPPAGLDRDAVLRISADQSSLVSAQLRSEVADAAEAQRRAVEDAAVAIKQDVVRIRQQLADDSGLHVKATVVDERRWRATLEEMEAYGRWQLADRLRSGFAQGSVAERLSHLDEALTALQQHFDLPSAEAAVEVWPAAFRTALSAMITEATREAIALRAWATPQLPQPAPTPFDAGAVPMPTLQEAFTGGAAASGSGSGVIGPMSPRSELAARSPNAPPPVTATGDALGGSGSSAFNGVPATSSAAWLDDTVARITSDLAFQFAERFSVYEVSLKEHDEQLREDLRAEFDDLEGRLDSGLRALRLTMSQRLDDKADRHVVEAVRNDVSKRFALELEYTREAVANLRALVVRAPPSSAAATPLRQPDGRAASSADLREATLEF